MFTCERSVVEVLWDLYFMEKDPFLVFFLALVMVVNAKWVKTHYVHVYTMYITHTHKHECNHACTVALRMYMFMYMYIELMCVYM